MKTDTSGLSIDEISELSKSDLETAKKALALVQSFDPPGNRRQGRKRMSSAAAESHEYAGVTCRKSGHQ